MANNNICVEKSPIMNSYEAIAIITNLPRKLNGPLKLLQYYFKNVEILCSCNVEDTTTAK